MTRINVQHSDLLRHRKRIGNVLSKLRDLKDCSATTGPDTMAKGLQSVETELQPSERYLARLQKQAEDEILK